jgi:glycosyltransferase involved in cell wall biosynthesis
MSAGIPIVSSLRGETESLLRDERCGVTYRPQEAGSLSAAIESLARDSGRRRQMAGNCLRLFESRFRAERIYDQMLLHLERLVTRANRTPVPVTRAA